MLLQMIKKYLMVVAFCLLFFFDPSSITGAEVPNIKNDIEKAYNYSFNRKLEKAYQIFDSIINHNDKAVEAYIGRAYVLSLQQQQENALEDISHALSLDNQSAKAYYVRGLIRLREEQYEEAHGDFDKALEIDTDYKPAIAGKIETFFMEDDLRQAFFIAEEAINNYPDYGDFYYHFGKVLSKRNRHERAIEVFNKALELHVEVYPFDILLNRADAKQNLDMLEEALLDYNEAIMINNNKSSIYHVRGVVHYKLDRYEKAIVDFERSIEIIEQDETRNAVNSNTYYNLGMSYLRIEDRTSACQNFHKGCRSGNQNACRMVIIRCSQQ